ncbi:hypothetical protein DFH09DRAFT_1344353 [Mycena vulgaris]|nr:hypothetical protein DFH09DRAFT_1344353 [Mycena vulgaris]
MRKCAEVEEDVDVDLRLQPLANYAIFAHFVLVKHCLYLFAAVPRTNASLPACRTSTPDTHRFVGVRMSTWKFCDWAEELHTDASMHGVVLLAYKKLNALAAQLFPDAPPPFAGNVTRMMAGAAGFLREEEGQEPLFVSGPDTQVSWASAAWLSLSNELHVPLAKRALLATLAHPAAVRPLTPYCFHHVAEALAAMGAERECVALVREYWGGMLAADTFGECFDPLDARRSP